MQADIVKEARREMAEAQSRQLFLECTGCGSVAGQFDSTIARNDVITHLRPKIAEELLDATGGLPWVDRAGNPLPYQGHPRWGVITSPAAVTEDELLTELIEAIDIGT